MFRDSDGLMEECRLSGLYASSKLALVAIPSYRAGDLVFESRSLALSYLASGEDRTAIAIEKLPVQS